MTVIRVLHSGYRRGFTGVRTPIFGIAAPHKGARKDGLIIVIIPLRVSGADETTDGQSEFGGAVDRITRSAAYRIAVIGEKQRGVFD